MKFEKARTPMMLLAVVAMALAFGGLECAAVTAPRGVVKSAPELSAWNNWRFTDVAVADDREYAALVPQLQCGAWRKGKLVQFGLYQVSDGAFEWNPYGTSGWRFSITLSTDRRPGHWNYQIEPVKGALRDGWNPADSTAGVWFIDDGKYGRGEPAATWVPLRQRGRLIVIDLPFIEIQDDGWMNWTVTTYAGKRSADEYHGGSKTGAPPSWMRPR